MAAPGCAAGERLGRRRLQGDSFNVYCFVEVTGCREAHEFGDEKFYPKQRGKGSNWAKWYKP
jgi:hypothetical protein